MAVASVLVVLVVRRRRQSAVALEDHAVQSRLRTTLIAAKAYWIQTSCLPDARQLAADGAAVLHGDRPVTADHVYVHAERGRLLFSALSRSGRAYYLAFDPNEGGVYGYADDAEGRSATIQNYTSGWAYRLPRRQQRVLARRLDSQLDGVRKDMAAVMARVTEGATDEG